MEAPASDRLAVAFGQWSGLGDCFELGDWTFVPLVENGAVLLLAAMRGTEIHVAVAPEFRGRVITRRRCREFLGPLLERRGYLTTRAVEGTDRIHFLQRLGFRLTGAAGGINHYMLTAVPFQKEH